MVATKKTPAKKATAKKAPVKKAEQVEVPMTLVIPTGQYANIQPSVTGRGATFEEAQRDALLQAESFYKSVGSPASLTLNLPKDSQSAPANDITVSSDDDTIQYKPQVCAVTGTVVEFDEATHKYKGDWLSGSAFSGRYKKEFDRDNIGAAFAAKHEVPVEEVFAMWDTNAEASTSLGTAVHAALELYGKYLALSVKTKGDTTSALHKNPILRDIVTSFYAGREDEQAFYEPFVANEEFGLCGFIDRLLVVDRATKTVRVQDYKTNPNIFKKADILPPFKGVVDNTSLGAYWLQLSFYAFILEEAGYVVQGLDIFNHNGEEWSEYSHDVIDVGPEVRKIRGNRGTAL